VKIAAATHETVLATDTEVGKGEAHVFRVEPNGAESQYDQNAKASNTVSNPEPFSQDKAEPSTASLNSQSDLNNSPASGPPSTAANNRPSNADTQVTGTSGSYSQSQSTAAQNPAPRQQASSELPKTASPYALFGFLGLLSLAGGLGLRLARSTY